MANHLDGDRKRLGLQESRGVDFRLWLVLLIALAAISYAVWRHAG